ncbi:MAG: hypothetical protein JSV61_06630 [Anaerolineales bacterium]|nr:MAG: hypothetical protein JSV61_06630 [Anaerolineales bacterium]
MVLTLKMADEGELDYINALIVASEMVDASGRSDISLKCVTPKCIENGNWNERKKQFTGCPWEKDLSPGRPLGTYPGKRVSPDNSSAHLRRKLSVCRQRGAAGYFAEKKGVWWATQNDEGCCSKEPLHNDEPIK